MTSPFVTENLTKRFAATDRCALDAITLEIPTGRIVGLLGRNGAGKSTLLQTACGLILPSSGTCTTLGRPCAELDAAELSRLGFVAQDNRFLAWMTVRQQLRFH